MVASTDLPAPPAATKKYLLARVVFSLPFPILSLEGSNAGRSVHFYQGSLKLGRGSAMSRCSVQKKISIRGSIETKKEIIIRTPVIEEGQRMLLAYCRHNFAKQHVRALLLLLVAAVVVSLWSPSAVAQTCAVIDKGQSRGQCANPKAACKSGEAQGVCTTSGPKGEYECDCKTAPPPPPPPPPPVNCAAFCSGAPLVNRLFYIQDLGSGRCIDAGPPQSWAPGSPVFINACDHTNGQEIRVTEIDHMSHDVVLSVYPIFTNAPLSSHIAVTAPTAPVTTSTGATNTGFCIGVHGRTVATNAALELQACSKPLSPAQRFAVDGDAILMGSQAAGTKVTRDFVIERASGSTVPQTPLVVATRVVSEEEPLRIDARYFRFNAVDGSGATPTSGFLTVSDQPHLACAATQCGWGTVVQIDDSQPLVLTDLSYPGVSSTGVGLGNIEVADGTTIRGYRSYTYNGPEIRTCVDSDKTDWPVFQATGQAVRFTGFRLHGPNGDSRCGKIIEDNTANQVAISASRAPYWSLPLPSVWIDRMEISHWPAAGTGAGSAGFPGDPNAQPSPCTGCGYPDTPIALMVGNFMHYDQYEVSPSGGQFAQIRANVFYGSVNQPVASREMSCLGGYAAMDNFFLSEIGTYTSDEIDMHGSVNYTGGSSWDAGLAGDYFDVGWNTFLKNNQTFLWWNPGVFQHSVNERGSSCRFTNIHDNVFLQSQGMAIRAGSANSGQLFIPPVESGNSFNQDPTQGRLLVGDFDGDGIDDVFLATGAVWYYSSGGQAEWRYLNRASESASALLLGDFDGDGRTDVLTVHGSNIDVSWAGVSAWQTINVTNGPFADLAVGDFDGDGRSDLLLATGAQWLLASGGQNWTSWAAPHTDTISNLRFGHFTDKSKTQILRVQNHKWQVTEWGTTSWADIGDSPVDSVAGLVAGDFNGDGYTDLAESTLLVKWQYTSPGHNSSWSPLGASFSSIQSLPIGNFQGGKQDGVITWGGNGGSHFYFTHAPQNESQILSRQVMR